MKESACKDTLKVFAWNYDAYDMKDLIKSMLEVLSEHFSALERIELKETLMGSKGRNKLRKEFAAKGIKLLLSDRQTQEDEGETSESDD